MFIAKNIFVYLLSMLALCLLIILFNYLGMNQTLNLIISSALFGIFITWYYKGSGLCIALFSFFYWAMFVISQSEPYRVCRRLSILRECSDDQIKIYP